MNIPLCVHKNRMRYVVSSVVVTILKILSKLEERCVFLVGLYAYVSLKCLVGTINSQRKDLWTRTNGNEETMIMRFKSKQKINFQRDMWFKLVRVTNLVLKYYNLRQLKRKRFALLILNHSPLMEAKVGAQIGQESGGRG